MSEEKTKTVFELVSDVDEFLSMHDLFKDEDLDLALSKIVKIISKPDVPPSAATSLVVQLEAIAAKLHIQASYLKNIDKPKPNSIDYQRKAMYFSVVDAIRQLTAGLKYLCRL